MTGEFRADIKAAEVRSERLLEAMAKQVDDRIKNMDDRLKNLERFADNHSHLVFPSCVTGPPRENLSTGAPK